MTIPSGDAAMPSPFPGMDPYLEAPHIWPDFHHALAAAIRATLNRTLPQHYYAQIEMRPEVGIVDLDDSTRRVSPDVAVLEYPQSSGEGRGTATLMEARTELSEAVDVRTDDEPMRHYYVEIRDVEREHRLITLIEIVSPSNKHPGRDREAYLRKQTEVLSSAASLVEIDLHRRGQRLAANPGLERWIGRRRKPLDYLVVINSAWEREISTVHSIGLRQILPVIGIPLRESDNRVPLDLQFVVNRAYDDGPYLRGAIDYSGSPEPPLRTADSAWAAEILKHRFA